MGITRRTSPEEGENDEICRQNDGNGLWDANGIIFIDYLEKGWTINGE